MAGLVPGRVVLGTTQTKRAAEVDDARAGVDQDRGQLHGSLRRGRQENERNLLLFNGLRSKVDMCRTFGRPQRRLVRGIPVVQKNRRDMGMAIEQAHQFRPTVSAISDNAYPMFHGFLFATVNNYNIPRDCAPRSAVNCYSLFNSELNDYFDSGGNLQ